MGELLRQVNPYLPEDIAVTPLPAQTGSMPA
jgi:hypothetical protein